MSEGVLKSIKVGDKTYYLSFSNKEIYYSTSSNKVGGTRLRDLRLYNNQLESYIDGKWKRVENDFQIAEMINNDKSSGGCFISTAVCNSQNLPDDCDELVTLRSFRDNKLLNDSSVSHLVFEYYEKSPSLVYKLEKNITLSNYIYNSYITCIVSMIHNDFPKHAIIRKYKEMFNYILNYKE